MKKVMAVALLTMLSNWAAAAEAPLTAVTNVGAVSYTHLTLPTKA